MVPPTALVLLGAFSAQLGPAPAKHLFGGVSSFGAVALRLFFASPVLILFWRLSPWLDLAGIGVVVLGRRWGGRGGWRWCVPWWLRWGYAGFSGRGERFTLLAFDVLFVFEVFMLSAFLVHAAFSSIRAAQGGFHRISVRI